MNTIRTTAAFFAAAATFACASAMAQGTPDTAVQRNINQQQRIEQGLKDGSLNTREAARLERGEARIERMESRAMRDGNLSDAERARINNAQNAESQRIYNQRHDAQTGDPNSASSRRMQADVQRNVYQQERIQAGVKNGSLTNREAGNLERGQSRINRAEARAGADGHVGPVEQRNIQARENRQSANIYAKKHNGRHQ